MSGLLRRTIARPLLFSIRIHFSKFRLKSTTGGSGSTAVVVEKDLAKDVVLYRHEKPRFLTVISAFSFFQFTFWLMMVRNMMDMKDTRVEVNDSTPFWKRINWGEDTTKKVMAGVCFVLGNLSICVGWFFVFRSIRYLILRKNQEIVSVVTYTPIGKYRVLEVPLNHISSHGNRTERGYMPMKIKGRFFMFVVDSKNGLFPNTKLFDQTVGLHRKL